jgi:hypothetical protein
VSPLKGVTGPLEPGDPDPRLLAATTLKVYGVPLVKPATLQVVAVVVEQPALDGTELTV